MITNKINENVRELLIKYPKLRDDDMKLVSKYWEHYDYAGLFIYDVLNSMYFNNLTHFESIRRARQLLQEKDETLRGLKYKKRKKLGEEVRATISK